MCASCVRNMCTGSSMISGGPKPRQSSHVASMSTTAMCVHVCGLAGGRASRNTSRRTSHTSPGEGVRARAEGTLSAQSGRCSGRRCSMARTPWQAAVTSLSGLIARVPAIYFEPNTVFWIIISLITSREPGWRRLHLCAAPR
jgi:hypothetical protein